MTDMQDRSPRVRMGLKKVGITSLKIPIRTEWKGKDYRFSPHVEIAIDLPEDKKGVHMSRLIEAITEAVEEEAAKSGKSIESTGARVLDHLAAIHPFTRGEMTMELDFFTEKTTPATKKKTIEAHQVMVKVIKDGGNMHKKLSVTVIGNTVCPHALSVCGVPHIQRAVATLTVESEYDKTVHLEQMIDCVEGSFSSEVYTLLKTADESAVVKRMHDNPMFVEDVVREILAAATKAFPGTRVRARVVSHESIHRHDVVAEGEA